MILKVFSVFDSKMATFDRPFYALTNAAAIRSFTDAVAFPGSPERPNGYHDHPEDFSLYCLGEFDDQSGFFSSESERPVSLVTGSSVLVNNGSAQLDMFDKNGVKPKVSA